jgi:hypothetical protein
MLNPAPRIICWGEELALTYNEAALPLVSIMGKHPDCLGQPMALFWSELLKQGMQAMFDEVLIRGRAKTVENFFFAIHRAPSSSWESPDTTFSHSHDTYDLDAKESYFTFTLLPIFDANGRVTGILDEGTETTPYVIADRRLATILRIEDHSSEVTTLKDVWKTVLDGLDQNEQDVPFAFLYSGTDDPTAKSVAQRLSLEGSIGLPMEHPLAQLKSPNTSLTTFIEKAWNSGKPMIVKCSDLKWQREGTVSPRQNNELDLGSNTNDQESVQETKSKSCRTSPSFHRLSSQKSISSEDSALHHRPFVVPGRGFGTQVTSVLILPIPRLGSSEPIGALVLGMNPLRPYDNEYQIFQQQLTESLIRSVASISVPEEQRRQEQSTREMAREHARISSHLMGKTQEAEWTGVTLKRLAEAAPVGMAMFAPDGKQIWVNQGYADHVRMAREDIDIETVKTNIHPDDKVVVDDAKEGNALPLNELRILRGKQDANSETLPGDDGYNWIIAAPSVLYNESGQVELILGW